MFEPIAPFVQRSETSLEAAIAIAKSLPNLEGRVYDILAAQGASGATDEEIAMAYPSWTGETRKEATLRARRVSLTAKGLVLDSGQTRPGVSGRQMTVWVVV